MVLKLCTYNICMHLYGLHQNLRDNQKLERMTKIIDWLREGNYPYDIICLQEVFYRASQRLLQRELGSEYHIILPNRYYCGFYNSGLVTLIRKGFHVSEIHEQKFGHQGNLASSIFPRTFQSVTFTYKDRPVVVTNAHITSPEFYGTCEQHEHSARQQLAELTSMDGLILGDLNLEQLNLPTSLQSSNFATSTINTQSLLTTEFTKCNHSHGQMDYILVPSALAATAHFELSDFDQSDHFPVIARFD